MRESCSVCFLATPSVSILNRCSSWRHESVDSRIGSIHRNPARVPSSLTFPRGGCRNILRMQTWSDPAVTQEYMDFLNGENQREMKKDCRSTIVGRGRVGNFLYSRGDGTDLVISRGEKIPHDAPGPVYICTRNDELESIVEGCPESKREDLVFIQNGMLEPFLRRYGLSEVTRANVYFAVAQMGKDPIDGITTENPEGLTCVTGKWEGAFETRILNAGLSCKILKERDFRRASLEKLIWISAFNLVGAVHGNITMGQVSDKHEDEVTELCVEMAKMIRYSLTVGMMGDIELRLLAYARSVKNFPTAIKEWPWRNGYFYNHSQTCLKNGWPDPTPMHTNYLEEGKKLKLIDW